MYNHKKSLLFIFNRASHQRQQALCSGHKANLVVECIFEPKSLGSEPSAAFCPTVFPL